VAFRKQSTVEPTSIDDRVAKKMNDFIRCDCVATAPECLASEQRASNPDGPRWLRPAHVGPAAAARAAPEQW